MYVLDDRGRFGRANDAFLDLVGYSRDRLVGSGVSLVRDETAVGLGETQLRRLPADDGPGDLRSGLDVEAADGTVRRREWHRRTRPGRGVHRRVYDAAGPLNAAQGHLDPVCEALCPDAPARDSLDAADRSTASTPVRDLSDALRGGPADLAPLAREAWTPLASAAATLDVDDAPGVVADRSAARRLLENPFRNALDHAGSDVAVAVRPVSGGFCVDGSGSRVSVVSQHSIASSHVERLCR